MSSERQVFQIHIVEGKGFGSAPQALQCSAALAGEAKATPFSVSTDAHAWNSMLAWTLERDEARHAKSCKLSVTRKDGLRLGWIVLDLRSAKLQHQYKTEPAGEAPLRRRCCPCMGIDPGGLSSLQAQPCPPTRPAPAHTHMQVCGCPWWAASRWMPPS